MEIGSDLRQQVKHVAAQQRSRAQVYIIGAFMTQISIMFPGTDHSSHLCDLNCLLLHDPVQRYDSSRSVP